MQKQNTLDEIQKLWEQEIDKYVLRAATEDIEEYPQEVRKIIIEEAISKLLNSNLKINFVLSKETLSKEDNKDGFVKSVLNTFKGRVIREG